MQISLPIKILELICITSNNMRSVCVEMFRLDSPKFKQKAQSFIVSF